MESFTWMAWTTPTAIFFCAIAVSLLILTVWEWRSPTYARRGFLPMDTTRGDRFFVSLLCAALIHICWVGLSDLPVWWVSVGCILSTLIIMRWG